MEETTSEKVKRIRAKTGLSQSKFARRYGLPLRTIQNWEQSRRQHMDAAGRILIKLIDIFPEEMARRVAEIKTATV